MRTPFIAGNWKMNLDRAAALRLVDGLAEARSSFAGVEVGVFPPFTMIADVARAVAAAPGASEIRVGAQDCHPEAKGAYTGDVSASHVRDAGATHVILGHSERRRDHAEDEPLLRRKLAAATAAGLVPILCVGETLDEREADRTLDVVSRQVLGALEGFDEAALASLVIAYEPVWAIGTGRTASPAQAAEVHRAIRGVLAERFSPAFAAARRIQYGGSVTAENAAELLAEAEIDGALVGGASLKLDSFLAIARAANRAG